MTNIPHGIVAYNREGGRLIADFTTLGEATQEAVKLFIADDFYDSIQVRRVRDQRDVEGHTHPWHYENYTDDVVATLVRPEPEPEPDAQEVTQLLQDVLSVLHLKPSTQPGTRWIAERQEVVVSDREDRLLRQILDIKPRRAECEECGLSVRPCVCSRERTAGRYR